MRTNQLKHILCFLAFLFTCKIANAQTTITFISSTSAKAENIGANISLFTAKKDIQNAIDAVTSGS